MARCEVCHKDDDPSFEVVTAGSRHIFDSFECAIAALAPACETCGLRIVGHPLEEAIVSTAALTARSWNGRRYSHGSSTRGFHPPRPSTSQEEHRGLLVPIRELPRKSGRSSRNPCSG